MGEEPHQVVGRDGKFLGHQARERAPGIDGQLDHTLDRGEAPDMQLAERGSAKSDKETDGELGKKRGANAICTLLGSTCCGFGRSACHVFKHESVGGCCRMSTGKDWTVWTLTIEVAFGNAPRWRPLVDSKKPKERIWAMGKSEWSSSRSPLRQSSSVCRRGACIKASPIIRHTWVNQRSSRRGDGRGRSRMREIRVSGLCTGIAS